MSTQGWRPPETDEEQEATRVKLKDEAKRRADWRWGNYFRENATGGGSNTRMIDWRSMPSSMLYYRR